MKKNILIASSIFAVLSAVPYGAHAHYNDSSYYQDGSYYQTQPYQGQQRQYRNQDQGNYYNSNNGQDSYQNRQNQRSYYDSQGQQNYYENQGQGMYRDQGPQNMYGDQGRQRLYGYQSNQDNGNQNPQNYNNSNRQGYYADRQDSVTNDSQSGMDQTISKKVHDIVGAGWLSKGFQNVTYEVQNGKVTLRGNVDTIDDKNKIEEKVRKIKAVRSVDNQIVVTGKQTAYNDMSTNDYSMDDTKNNKYPLDTAATESDRQLNAKIRDKLNSGWFSRGYENIVIKTSNGVVVITGTVDSLDDIKKMNDQIKDVEGIKTLKNQVNVKK